jgi:hypothetical protein
MTRKVHVRFCREADGGNSVRPPINVMLIKMQRPDATRVAGYRKWQELVRLVLVDELEPISGR